MFVREEFGSVPHRGLRIALMLRVAGNTAEAQNVRPLAALHNVQAIIPNTTTSNNNIILKIKVK